MIEPLTYLLDANEWTWRLLPQAVLAPKKWQVRALGLMVTESYCKYSCVPTAYPMRTARELANACAASASPVADLVDARR